MPPKGKKARQARQAQESRSNSPESVRSASARAPSASARAPSASASAHSPAPPAQGSVPMQVDQGAQAPQGLAPPTAEEMMEFIEMMRAMKMARQVKPVDSSVFLPHRSDDHGIREKEEEHKQDRVRSNGSASSVSVSRGVKAIIEKQKQQIAHLEQKVTKTAKACGCSAGAPCSYLTCGCRSARGVGCGPKCGCQDSESGCHNPHTRTAMLKKYKKLPRGGVLFEELEEIGEEYTSTEYETDESDEE